MVNEKKRRCHLVSDYRQKKPSCVFAFYSSCFENAHTHTEAHVWRLRRYKRSKKESVISKRVCVCVCYANAPSKHTNREGFRLCACFKQWVTHTTIENAFFAVRFNIAFTLYFTGTCIWKMLVARKPIQNTKKKTDELLCRTMLGFSLLFPILCFVSSHFIGTHYTQFSVCFADSHAFALNSSSLFSTCFVRSVLVVFVISIIFSHFTRILSANVLRFCIQLVYLLRESRIFVFPPEYIIVHTHYYFFFSKK